MEPTDEPHENRIVISNDDLERRNRGSDSWSRKCSSCGFESDSDLETSWIQANSCPPVPVRYCTDCRKVHEQEQNLLRKTNQERCRLCDKKYLRPHFIFRKNWHIGGFKGYQNVCRECYKTARAVEKHINKMIKNGEL